MLAIAIDFDRHKSVPQLLCNRTLKCSKIHVFELNMNAMRFSSFLVRYIIIPLKISYHFFRLYIFKFQLTVKQYLDVLALHYTTVVVNGRFVIPLIGLTTPVGWLSLPKLTVQSRSAIVV